jgi:tetrahydromethanopterin S-methyltransferase subunit G
MAKKNFTINDLGGMVQRGFGGVHEELNKKFYEVNKRLDNIEVILLKDYRQRIENLEDQVRELQADYRQLIGHKK